MGKYMTLGQFYMILSIHNHTGENADMLEVFPVDMGL